MMSARAQSQRSTQIFHSQNVKRLRIFSNESREKVSLLQIAFAHTVFHANEGKNQFSKLKLMRSMKLFTVRSACLLLRLFLSFPSHLTLGDINCIAERFSLHDYGLEVFLQSLRVRVEGELCGE
jgi:hypothetical protein